MIATPTCLTLRSALMWGAASTCATSPLARAPTNPSIPLCAGTRPNLTEKQPPALQVPQQQRENTPALCGKLVAPQFRDLFEHRRVTDLQELWATILGCLVARIGRPLTAAPLHQQESPTRTHTCRAQATVTVRKTRARCASSVSEPMRSRGLDAQRHTASMPTAWEGCWHTCQTGHRYAPVRTRLRGRFAAASWRPRGNRILIWRVLSVAASGRRS